MGRGIAGSDQRLILRHCRENYGIGKNTGFPQIFPQHKSFHVFADHQGDYRDQADYYYYELGGNMRLRFTPEEFKERASHIVNETRRKNPFAPIILTQFSVSTSREVNSESAL